MHRTPVLSFFCLLALTVAAGCIAPEAPATLVPAATAVLTAPTATAAPAKALATATAASSAAAAGAAGAVLRQIEFQGISFTYPPVLARGAAGQAVAAAETGQDAPWWLPAPAYRAISLEGYALGNTSQAPMIAVYPAAEFASANAQAAKRIASLRALLAEAPANPSGDLPFLPLINAKQEMHTGEKYLAFRGGRGVAYLTQYAQAPLSVNNHDLIYTFQGLTDDGRYYVSAVLPVAHRDLPADGTSLPADGKQSLAAILGASMGGAIQVLEAQPSGFTPALADLEGLVRSIEVRQ